MVNQCIMINTLKLKEKYTMIGYIQIFNVIKNPKIISIFGCLCLILLDSIFVNSDKEYHPQILLEERKYAIKNEKNSK